MGFQRKVKEFGKKLLDIGSKVWQYLKPVIQTVAPIVQTVAPAFGPTGQAIGKVAGMADAGSRFVDHFLGNQVPSIQSKAPFSMPQGYLHSGGPPRLPWKDSGFTRPDASSSRLRFKTSQ